MSAGVLASLAELELGRERRVAAREARRARGQFIGRRKVLDASKAVLAQRTHTSGESATTYCGNAWREPRYGVPGACGNHRLSPLELQGCTYDNISEKTAQRLVITVDGVWYGGNRCDE